MKVMTELKGGCMCGAVRFTASNVPEKFGACHCEMCRRWAGSAFLGVSVAEADVAFSGQENISILQSSEWAERAWCNACGTGLWYRVTAPGGPLSGKYELPVGLFDSTDGMTLVSEIFIDCKSGAFAFAGDTKKLTRAEVMARYGVNFDEGAAT
jgi:hypothetical protein